MKNIDYDKMYREWSGVSHVANSCQKTHDSAEAIDFAQYCVNEVLEETPTEETTKQFKAFCESRKCDECEVYLGIKGGCFKRWLAKYNGSEVTHG